MPTMLSSATLIEGLDPMPPIAGVVAWSDAP
jgi:hypothetical protein